jgi:hypothetical protein
MITLSFPLERPDASPSAVWGIQNILLTEAERSLGPKDPAKLVYQPIFSKDGPHIIVHNTEDGAYANLSLNAAGFWPTAVYELAHETVHLLNPVKGPASVLEEGVAETFALRMGEKLGGFKQSSPECYKNACDAVALLGSDVLASGKTIREKCGSLSQVSTVALKNLFPSAQQSLLELLVKKFERK